MKSGSFDIDAFIETIKHQDWMAAIHLANQEATAAERWLHKNKKKGGHHTDNAKQYADILKGVIVYLRNGVKTSSIQHVDIHSLDSIRRGWIYPDKTDIC